MKKHTVIPLLIASLLASCAPPMDLVLKQSASQKLACERPKPASAIKVFVRGEVEWNGKSASIANGYFTKRLKNVISGLDGFSLVPENEADLKIIVKRNNKFNLDEISRAATSVARKEVPAATANNDYDQWFVINGSGKTWSGNVPHGLIFIYGDPNAIKADGLLYGVGKNEGTFKSLVSADEAMLTQVVIYALKQAQLAGCYR
jgi:hypothetical protein